jgi:hypothetical protein
LGQWQHRFDTVTGDVNLKEAANFANYIIEKGIMVNSI